MNTCRFCKKMLPEVKYGTRHYAHFDCYLDAGKPLDALSQWQIKKFPYFLLKERGLLDEAARLTKPIEVRL
jgi:hypothetical protein